MVIDLKVLVKSFNCEDRSCYSGNPRESFFASSRNIFFIQENFAKVGYHESLSLYTLQLVKGYPLLPPRGPAGEWYRTFSLHRWQPSFRRWGFAAAKYHGLESHPCTCRWYCLTLLQMQQPSFQKWGLREPNTNAPGVCFSSDAPPADGWGLRKFRERVGESQSAFWREWPSKPCKKIA